MRPSAKIAHCAVSASASCVSFESVSITVTRGFEMLSSPSPSGTARRMLGSPYCAQYGRRNERVEIESSGAR